MSNASKIIIAATIILFGSIQTHSQTPADVEFGEILNSGDLFLLKKQYPALKDSINIEMLNLIAEAQLGIGFNRLERAATALDSLLQFHQEALGTEATVGIAALRAMNLLNMGLYSDAGQAGSNLANALKPMLPFEQLYSFVFIERVGKALANTLAPRLKRPQHDVVVPMTVDTITRGYHLHIPVTVNGITKNYIFDTGCPFGNFVSEKYAQEVELKIIADSVPVSGMTVGFVKLATADSLQIGEIIQYNPIFMIAPHNATTDSVLPFDGVLGYHFIRDIKETIIDNQNKTFIFPHKISHETTNMFFSSNVPNIRIEYNSQPFDIIFDSGSVKSDLGGNFAQLFPETLSGLTEQETNRGGFGGISTLNGMAIPEFHFTISGTPVTLYNTEVITYANNKPYSGALGADFILSFKRLTINYENMFVRGE